MSFDSFNEFIRKQIVSKIPLPPTQQHLFLTLYYSINTLAMNVILQDVDKGMTMVMKCYLLYKRNSESIYHLKSHISFAYV